MSTDDTQPQGYKSGLMRDDLKWSGIRRENERLERELAAANARNKHLETENKELSALHNRLAELLRGTADGLKGEPSPLMHHSWHDLPDWGAKARAVAMGYLAATAPGADIHAAQAFVAALQAWRDLYQQDLFETSLAFAELGKQA